MLIKAMPCLCAALLATSASGSYQVTQAHALATAIINDGPAILDEDWDMPLQVCAFTGGSEGIGSATGASFDFAGGFNGNASAQVNSWVTEPLLASGTLLDFTFVIDGDVTASLSVDMLLMSTGDAFGVVNIMLKDITENVVLMDLEQSQGSTQMVTTLDLVQGHNYQLMAAADAQVDVGDMGSASATLAFEILLPTPGTLALLGLFIASPRRRRTP